MNAIKILINGANGKMGQEVAKHARNMEGVDVLCGFDVKDNGDNFFPVFTNLEDIKELPDVVIDFSIPEASLNILEWSAKNKIPTVIATTGFDKEQLEKVKSYSKMIPVFQSSNMSYSVNVMVKVVAELAKLFNEDDIEIVETHHRRKIDAPSGTALMLANSINEALDNKFEYEYNRHARRESRPKNEIGIHSIRGGTEAGSHSVIFFGEEESFEIKHTSNSRGVFAEGALKAAKFIISKENGFYNMKDMM